MIRSPHTRASRSLALLLCLGLVGAACSPVAQAPSPTSQAPSPPSQAPGSAAAATVEPAADPALQALERRNAELQATLTARQGEAQVAIAQQTQTALQTAVARPEPAAAPAKPADAPQPAQVARPEPTAVPAKPADAPPAARTAPPEAAADTPADAAQAFFRSLVGGDVDAATELMTPSARTDRSTDLDELAAALGECGGSAVRPTTTGSGESRKVFATFSPPCGSYNEVIAAMAPVAAIYTGHFGSVKTLGCGIKVQLLDGRWLVASAAIGCAPAYS